VGHRRKTADPRYPRVGPGRFCHGAARGKKHRQSVGRRGGSLGPGQFGWINRNQDWHRFFEATDRYFGGTEGRLGNRIRSIRLNLPRDNGPVRADEGNPSVGKTLSLIGNGPRNRTCWGSAPGCAEEHERCQNKRGKAKHVGAPRQHGICRARPTIPS